MFLKGQLTTLSDSIHGSLGEKGHVLWWGFSTRLKLSVTRLSFFLLIFSEFNSAYSVPCCCCCCCCLGDVSFTFSLSVGSQFWLLTAKHRSILLALWSQCYYWVKQLSVYFIHRQKESWKGTKKGLKEGGKEGRKKEGNLHLFQERPLSKFYDDDALFSFNFNWKQPRITWEVPWGTASVGLEYWQSWGGALIELIDV